MANRLAPSSNSLALRLQNFQAVETGGEGTNQVLVVLRSDSKAGKVIFFGHFAFFL